MDLEIFTPHNKNERENCEALKDYFDLYFYG